MELMRAIELVRQREWQVPGYDQAKRCLHRVGTLEVATDLTMQIVPDTMGDVEIAEAIITILNNLPATAEPPRADSEGE